MRSHGDGDTLIKFVNDLHGAGNDGLQFVQSGNTMCSITPTQVHFPLAAGISADAGATFGGDVAIQGGLTCDGTGTFEDSVRISGSGDAVLNLVADTDNVTESHNPHINFSQDAGSNSFKMGMVGAAGSVFTNSYSDRPYVFSHWGLQIATASTARVDIHNSGVVHLYKGLSADSGITCGGTFDLLDNELVRPTLKDYSEEVAGVSYADPCNIDFTVGNVQTLSVSLSAADVAFLNPPATGTAGTITLIITNGGSQTLTWPSAVKWPGGNAPALTSSGVDILSFITIDAGTTIYGFVGGINFSAP